MLKRRARSGRLLVAAAGLLLVLLCACSGPQAPPASTAETSSRQEPATYAAELLDLTNEARGEEGLEPLEDSRCAREAAADRARALVGESELEHAPLAPVIEACAPLTTAAENLVNSEAASSEVLAAWLGSPGHRSNILDPDLTEIGIACIPDGEQVLCSQVFLGP